MCVSLLVFVIYGALVWLVKTEGKACSGEFQRGYESVDEGDSSVFEPSTGPLFLSNESVTSGCIQQYEAEGDTTPRQLSLPEDK